MRALLVLEDGFHLVGEAFAGEGETYAEIVLNTSLSGYQEILTDPSNYGRAVVFTYPVIGNYGVNDHDMESAHITPQAVIVREYTPEPSNYRSTRSFAEWLGRSRTLGIHQIDTRALMQHLRERGSMRAAITTRETDIASLARKAADRSGANGYQPTWTHGAQEPYTYAQGDGFRITVLDLGVKRSLLEQIAGLGCTVRVVPSDTSADQLLAEGSDAVVISSGPDNHTELRAATHTVSLLLGRIPVLGIGLGHAIVSRALGLEVFKMGLGHHGTGHPVKELATGRVHLTSQNHAFAVSTPGGADRFTTSGPNGPVDVTVTHRSMFDDTVEGLAAPDLRAYTLQFHPEGRPGPGESAHIARFLERIGDHA